MNNDKINHKKVGYLDDNGNFIPLIWNLSGEEIYFDDLYNVMDEQNKKIRAFARKCAPMKKPKKFNTRQIEHMSQLRTAGASFRCIAKEMGCAESTVRNYLKQKP